MHIWCRLGLPSTVLVFIIVLWPILGVYINQPVYGYDWALVEVHVTSSVVNAFVCWASWLETGENQSTVESFVVKWILELRVWNPVNYWFQNARVDNPKKTCAIPHFDQRKGGVTVAALHSGHAWHNEWGKAGHNVRLVGLEFASRWGEAPSIGRVNGDRAKTGPGWRQCCAILHLSLSTSCPLWH